MLVEVAPGELGQGRLRAALVALRKGVAAGIRTDSVTLAAGLHLRQAGIDCDLTCSERNRSGIEGPPMQLKKLLEKRDLTSLKIKAPFLDMEWEPRDEDKNAAWELYVEMITRVATQRLAAREPDRPIRRTAR